MLFKKVDLVHELQKENSKYSEADFLGEVKSILSDDVASESIIRNRIKEKNKAALSLESVDKLDYSLIFHKKAIQKICTDYRLRFLDSSYFKGEIPHEAVVKIKNLERTLNTELKSFKIVAPAERFMLQDSMKDPILFAQLADGRFYFIHQWGEDMSLQRKIASYPFRNIQSLGITIGLFSFLLVALLPAEWIPGFYHRTLALGLLAKAMIFFAVTGFLFTAAFITGIVTIKDFSESVWNDKFFN